MKSFFIQQILEIVKDSPQMLYDIFRRESIYRKDLRMGGFNPDKIYKGLRNMKSRGLVVQNKDGFRFTTQGRRWYAESAKKYFWISKDRWDGKWRVVIFDIPQELHYRRVRFGRKLKSLGFYMLQKSVFVFPYQCEDELGSICGKLEINDYVDVITANDIGFKESEIKKFFNLK